MEIIIESPHFTISEALKELAEKKASRLLQYDNRILKCNVLLKLEKSDTDDNKVCEIIIYRRHSQFFAASRSMTFEEAITKSVAGIAKQLRKKNGKRYEAEQFNVAGTEGE